MQRKKVLQIRFKEKVEPFAQLGSVIVSKNGEPKLIIEDTSCGKTKYAYITLDGHVITKWYDSIFDLLNGTNIVKTIPNSKLVLAEV